MPENTVSDIGEVLSVRGSRYGEFSSHARITQCLKCCAETFVPEGEDHPAWGKLSPEQQEAVHMIFHKIGRILNGDPNYADSWVDIAGYAKLVSDKLEKGQNGK